VKEFVPKAALTFVANTFYGEHYETVPMNHSIKHDSLSGDLAVEYQWGAKRLNSFKVRTQSTAVDIIKGSEAEFITEHYWGYTKLASSKTSDMPSNIRVGKSTR
jgi:hypothetical protein